jgi:RNAse (barnase) inhibitor barstar
MEFPVCGHLGQNCCVAAGVELDPRYLGAAVLLRADRSLASIGTGQVIRYSNSHILIDYHKELSADMRNLELDGTNWKITDDFYDAFFRAVGAPDWHGRNFDALRDSIVNGEINQTELPYAIHISGLDKMPPHVRKLVEDFCSLIKEFRAEGHNVDAVCRG